MLSLEGPFEFFSGFLNGTQILKTGETHTCERLIQEDFIHNANQIVNMTGVIIGTKDTFGESGTPTQLLTKYGLDAVNIVEAAKKVIARKK